jgi:hypothetical protein
VSTRDDLLKPKAERPKTFKLGSREFDPQKVGFKSEGPFEFDTALRGHSNAGHDDYGGKVFTADEREQLVEYMKSL